ncbi:MAG: hypothetical protein H6916_04050 [Novosphingobium sp.]|nr:hypothetical protein [Novosphingobium sp.]
MKTSPVSCAGHGKLPEFLARRVVVQDLGHTTPCLEWDAALHLGYGWVSHKGKPQLAHRLAYEAINGPIPEGPVKDRTHCPQGHAYAGDNLIIAKSGAKVCRICKRASDARRRARHV